MKWTDCSPTSKRTISIVNCLQPTASSQHLIHKGKHKTVASDGKPQYEAPINDVTPIQPIAPIDSVEPIPWINGDPIQPIKWYEYYRSTIMSPNRRDDSGLKSELPRAEKFTSQLVQRDAVTKRLKFVHKISKRREAHHTNMEHKGPHQNKIVSLVRKLRTRRFTRIR